MDKSRSRYEGTYSVSTEAWFSCMSKLKIESGQEVGNNVTFYFLMVIAYLVGLLRTI